MKRTEGGQKESDYNGREVGSKGDDLRSQSSSLRAQAQNVTSDKGESKKKQPKIMMVLSSSQWLREVETGFTEKQLQEY